MMVPNEFNECRGIRLPILRKEIPSRIVHLKNGKYIRTGSDRLLDDLRVFMKNRLSPRDNLLDDGEPVTPGSFGDVFLQTSAVGYCCSSGFCRIFSVRSS